MMPRCSIYIPLHLRVYETEGKLNIIYLCVGPTIKINGNLVKILYLVNNEFVRHHNKINKTCTMY